MLALRVSVDFLPILHFYEELLLQRKFDPIILEGKKDCLDLDCDHKVRRYAPLSGKAFFFHSYALFHGQGAAAANAAKLTTHTSGISMSLECWLP